MEYFKPVNLTRREFIDPHRLRCGLALHQWLRDGSPVVRLMKEKWAISDNVWAIGDGGGIQCLSGDENNPPPLGLELIDFVDISVAYCENLPWEGFEIVETIATDEEFKEWAGEQQRLEGRWVDGFKR
jgi:hypothetical protein